MSFTTAKDGEYFYVRTGIGDFSRSFKCKVIEEVENGFILKDVDNYEDDVLIKNAPVLITHQDLRDEFNK